MPTTITVEQIRQLATQQSFQRGQALYEQGAVQHLVVDDHSLEATCDGSQPEPYEVSVEWNNREITTTACTCEYDWEGVCKHVVALLLTYMNAPKSAKKKKSTKIALEQRSKEELILLINEMVKRHRDLAALLERPLPTANASKDEVINTAPFRAELQQAFKKMAKDEWGDRSLSKAIQSIARTAEHFIASDIWLSGRAIYSAILEECLSDTHIYMHFDEYDISALAHVVQQLIALFDNDRIAHNDKERNAVIDSLLLTFVVSCQTGHEGLDDGVVEAIVENATRADVPRIRAKLEASRSTYQVDAYREKWIDAAYEYFLMELDMLEEVDSEVTLERLRENGLYELLLDKLIELKRGKEAITLVQEHMTDSTYNCLHALTVLTKAGYGDVALPIGHAVLDKKFEAQLADWLIMEHQKRKDGEACLQLLQLQMQHFPSEANYASLKRQAQALHCWDALHLPLLEKLNKDKQYEALIDAYLNDEEWEAAWDVYQRNFPDKTSKSRGMADWVYQSKQTSLRWKLAERTAIHCPTLAIPIYIEQAQNYINGRNRDSYAQAAAVLTKARTLYIQINDKETWDKFIEGIRTQNKTLKALQDELKKAKL